RKLREKAVVGLVASADVELDSQAGIFPGGSVLGKNRARVDDAAEEVEAFGDVISDRRLAVEGARHTAEELTPTNHVHVLVGLEAEFLVVPVGDPVQVNAAARAVDAPRWRPALPPRCPAAPPLVIASPPSPIAARIPELQSEVQSPVDQPVLTLEHAPKLR